MKMTFTDKIAIVEELKRFEYDLAVVKDADATHSTRQVLRAEARVECARKIIRRLEDWRNHD